MKSVDMNEICKASEDQGSREKGHVVNSLRKTKTKDGTISLNLLIAFTPMVVLVGGNGYACQ